MVQGILDGILDGIAVGSIPLKFAYCGEEGADLHARHAQSAAYSEVSTPALPEPVLQTLKSVADKSNTRYLEIGPGTGLATMALIRQLGGLDHSLGFELLDFSPNILALAADNLARRGIVGVATRVFDLEAPDPVPAAPGLPEDRQDAYFLLGGTIGNVERVEETLAGLWHVTRHDDVLVLSCAIHRGAEESASASLDGYRQPGFLRGISTPLRMVGLVPEDYAMSVEFDAEEASYLGWAEIVRPCSARAGTRRLELAAGRKIRCFRSRRFSPADVTEVMQKSGWRVLGHDRRDQLLFVIAQRSQVRPYSMRTETASSI